MLGLELRQEGVGLEGIAEDLDLPLHGREVARRQRAERTYEVTEVNEMLQGMERFGGVFVCTTNLFDELDEAALRRFTFKIGFRPLTAAQRERMFVAVQRLDDEHALAPGDFAAVQRQVEILGDAFGPDAFLAQLEAEHRVKPEVRQHRPIGFLQSRA